tara:strand:+ start:6603 stop:6797 length:195 start_codon:yes stop_codon:yes gene_type:complete
MVMPLTLPSHAPQPMTTCTYRGVRYQSAQSLTKAQVLSFERKTYQENIEAARQHLTKTYRMVKY